MGKTQDSAYSLALFDQSKRRLDVFSTEVRDALWKRDHDEAMRCLSFEETLQSGVNFYEFLMRTDEAARAWLLKQGREAEEAAVLHHDHVTLLLQQWLAPCAMVESQIQHFEQQGFVLPLASTFRKYRAEAQWILMDDAEKFDHPAFHALEDAAIEELRAGTCKD